MVHLQLEFTGIMKPYKTIEKLLSGTPAVIVALGDSLTYGWMVSKGYLDYFKEKLYDKFPERKLNLINKGIPGDTARGGVHRLQGDVLCYEPDCVLIQFALNDAFAGYSPELFKGNMKEIINGIREGGNSEIVLVSSVCLGSERENAFIEVFYSQLEELARCYQLPVARVHEYWKKKISEGFDFENLVQADFVHPTSEGYRLMAEAVMEVFE